MIYKVLSNLKHNGKEYSAGEEISLDEEIAKGLVGDSILEPLEETPEEAVTGEDPATEETEEPDLNSLTVKELKRIAEEREIDLTGIYKKADIIEALEE